MLQQVTQQAKKVLMRFNDKGKQLNELPRTRTHTSIHCQISSLEPMRTHAQSVNA